MLCYINDFTIFNLVVGLFTAAESGDFTNYNLEHIITPLKVDVLEKLLIQSEYDKEETKFLVNGFKEGFDIGYKGPIK